VLSMSQDLTKDEIRTHDFLLIILPTRCCSVGHMNVESIF
jgi:hypothetical protein